MGGELKVNDISSPSNLLYMKGQADGGKITHKSSQLEKLESQTQKEITHLNKLKNQHIT